MRSSVAWSFVAVVAMGCGGGHGDGGGAARQTPSASPTAEDFVFGPDRSCLRDEHCGAGGVCERGACAGLVTGEAPWVASRLAAVLRQGPAPRRDAAVRLLRRVLGDVSAPPSFRARAAWALALLGDGSSRAQIDALAVHRDDDAVRRRARLAGVVLGRPLDAEEWAEWVRHAPDVALAAALDVSASVGPHAGLDAAAVDAARNVLANPRMAAMVRLAATRALGATRPEDARARASAEAALSKVIQRPSDAWLAVTAVRALERLRGERTPIGDSRAVP